jgi:hypothetical protein
METRTVNKNALGVMKAFYNRSLNLNRTFNLHKESGKLPSSYVRRCKKMYDRIRKFFDVDLFTEEKFGKTIPNGSTLFTKEIIAKVEVSRGGIKTHNELIIKKMEVYFGVENNQDTNDFPYIGVHLILNFYGENDDFYFAIAKSREGSKNILPMIVDPLTLAISSGEATLTFHSRTEYNNVFNFCQEVIKTINKELKGKELINNVI